MELIIKCTYSQRYTQILLLICDEIHEKFVFFFVSLKQFTKKDMYLKNMMKRKRTTRLARSKD